MAWCWWCSSILSGHFSENNQEASHEGFWIFGPKIDQIPLKNSAEQTEFCDTHHAFFPYYRHPVLNTIHSIGNLGKIILPKSFLAAVESTVVRPCCGQVIAVIETQEGRGGWGDRKCQEETAISFPGLLTPFSTESQKTAMEDEQLFKAGRKRQVSSCPVCCEKLFVNLDLSICEWRMSECPRMVYSSTKMIIMPPLDPRHKTYINGLNGLSWGQPALRAGFCFLPVALP